MKKNKVEKRLKEIKRDNSSSTWSKGEEEGRGKKRERKVSEREMEARKKETAGEREKE